MTRFNNATDSNDESQELGDSASEKYKWTPKAVTKLLTLRFEREHDFTYPIGKKIRIWDEIGEELKKDGLNFNGHACFSKYRNLISTYRRRKQMGDSFCRWEHFDLMDSHFGGKDQDSDNEVVEETYEETASGEDGSHSYYIVQQVDDVEIQGHMQQVEDVEMVVHEDVEIQDAEEHEVHVEIHEGEEFQEHEEEEGNHIEEIKVIVDPGDSEEFYWNPDATRLLLNLRLSKNYQWLKPNAKKLDLWNNLSKEMKEHNFNVEGHHCDMKYRNLLKTYRANKERMEKDGLACNWPYFELMDSYLAFQSSGLVESVIEKKIDRGDNTAVHSVFYNIIQDTVVDEDEGNKRNKVSGYQWTPPAIRLLLNLRLEREHLFNKPLCRKLKLWNEISREMKKNGFDVPSHACHDKWRNTLTTYRKIKQKLEAYPEKTFVRWEYFKIMDSHLGHIPYKFTPMRKLLKTHLSYKDILEIQKGPQGGARVGVAGGAAGTVGKRRQEEDVTVQRDDMADLEDVEEEESSSSKKPKLTLSDFLQKKLQADEKNRRERQVYEEKILKVELQKLELERKKMEILKNLLSVLKSKTIT